MPFDSNVVLNASSFSEATRPKNERAKDKFKILKSSGKNENSSSSLILFSASLMRNESASLESGSSWITFISCKIDIISCLYFFSPITAIRAIGAGFSNVLMSLYLLSIHFRKQNFYYVLYYLWI